MLDLFLLLHHPHSNSPAASNGSWLDSSCRPREQPGAEGWRARKTSARLTSAWEFGIPCAQRKRQLCEPVPPGGNRRMCYGRASVPVSLVWCCGSSDVTVLLRLLLFPAFKSTPSLPPRGDGGFIITSRLLGKRDRVYSFSRDQSGARAPVLHAGKTHWHRDRVTERKPCSKVCILSSYVLENRPSEAQCQHMLLLYREHTAS